MVDRNYMLKKPAFPAAWKEFLDTAIVPAAIDALGSVEAGLERIAVLGRQRPLASVGVAFGLGCGSALWLRRSASESE